MYSPSQSITIRGVSSSILIQLAPCIDKEKRAQKALGRSPEEKVKGHSGANKRGPQGHNLNNFVEDLLMMLYI